MNQNPLRIIRRDAPDVILDPHDNSWWFGADNLYIKDHLTSVISVYMAHTIETFRYQGQSHI